MDAIFKYNPVYIENNNDNIADLEIRRTELEKRLLTDLNATLKNENGLRKELEDAMGVITDADLEIDMESITDINQRIRCFYSLNKIILRVVFKNDVIEPVLYFEYQGYILEFKHLKFKDGEILGDGTRSYCLEHIYKPNADALLKMALLGVENLDLNAEELKEFMAANRAELIL